MTDLRRQLLTLSERLNETASTSTTHETAEGEAEASEDMPATVRYRQSAPSSGTQPTPAPRNGSVIRSSSQIFAGNNLGNTVNIAFSERAFSELRI